MADHEIGDEVWLAPKAVHPGEYVKLNLLPTLKITSAAELAKRAGLTEAYVQDLMDGKVSVTAEAAFGLGEVANSGPWLWIDLQVGYDLWHAYRRRHAEMAPLLWQ